METEADHELRQGHGQHQHQYQQQYQRNGSAGIGRRRRCSESDHEDEDDFQQGGLCERANVAQLPTTWAAGQTSSPSALNKMARHGMTRPSMAVKPLNAGSCFGAQPQLGEARPGQLNNIYHLIYNSSSATEIRPAQQVQLDLSRMSEDALAEAW